MTAIFYFTGFILSVILLSGVFNYPKMMKLKKLYNLTGDKSDNNKLEKIIRKEDRPAYLNMLIYAFSILSLMSWCAIGLLSNNWLAFLCILVGYVISSKLVNFIGGKKSPNMIKTIVYMLLTLAVSASCLFMAVNHFYLKYYLEPIIKNFFGLV